MSTSLTAAAVSVLALTVAIAGGAMNEPASAQTPAAAATPAPCSQAHYRDFDFWIGEWTVRDAHGQIVGHNTITREQGGCVLQEHWRSAKSRVTGTSFNVFDIESGRWHQTWVDNSGGLLVLNGGLTGSDMVLEGTMPDRQAGSVQHRITWTPLPGGKVRQHWITSSDGGKTWQDAFDGIYAPQ